MDSSGQSQRERLVAWRDQIRIAGEGHLRAESLYKRRNLALLISASVVSTLVAVGAALNVANYPGDSLKIALLVASIAVPILSAIQSIFRDFESSENHRNARIEFWKLAQQIDEKIEFNFSASPATEQLIGSLRKRFDQLTQESPPLPKRIRALLASNGN